MNIWPLLRGDIRFQYKYGFYFLYLFFTLLYVSLLMAFPETWREKGGNSDDLLRPDSYGSLLYGSNSPFGKKRAGHQQHRCFTSSDPWIHTVKIVFNWRYFSNSRSCHRAVQQRGKHNPSVCRRHFFMFLPLFCSRIDNRS